MKEPIFFVCAPADTPIEIEGSTQNLVCYDCHVRLMVAPSGQRFMEKNTTAVVLPVCPGCFLERMSSESEEDYGYAADSLKASLEEASEENS